ncbi:hypothetical protein F5B20DRAFT_588715 [Whalleya microplaca]|nr:hypothetical protein F5B20DRAFT_588715 [Whalleya microplaca]
MRTSTIAASIIAGLAFLPAVPAPPVFIALGASAATAAAMTSGLTSGLVSGSIGAGVGAGVACGAKKTCGHRRRAAYEHAEKLVREITDQLDMRGEVPGPGPAPKGVPQYNWDNCFHDALKSKITVHGPVGDNHIKVEGLPPSCMVLSTVLDGKTSGGPTPVPCGSACIEYSGMDVASYENIRKMINTQILHA